MSKLCLAELTAVAQYFNHSLTVPSPEVSNLLLCIALVEMKHMDMIGAMIEQLGGDPRFWQANQAYWSGGNVAYNRLLTRIEDPDIRRVLRRILRDEKVHLRLLQEALHKYC